MYIILSIFLVYALGIISFELNFTFYLFSIVFVVLLYNTIKSKKFIYNIVLFLFLILSILNCRYNSKSVLTQFIDEDIEVKAIIKSMNKPSNSNSKYNSFNATITNINCNQLSSRENTIIYIDKNKKIDANTIVKLNGKVAEINFSKNNLLFNYKNYLRAKKVYAIIFCTNDIVVLQKDYSKLNKIAINFKIYTENLFNSKLNDKNADILLSIILGDVDYLDAGFYDNIKAMGLAHIFAVSGSHIVLLYGALISFLKFIALNRRISWLITWTLIWIYGFLIGFPLSVMRTLVMFTLLFGSEVLYRKYNSLNSISLSALVLTIINPFWIFDAGFLLSFSAALSLILYSKYIKKNIETESKIIHTIYMFLFLQLFMLPVMAYYFNYIPIMGILYNLILIPIFTFILILGFILLLFNGLFWYVFIIPFKVLDLSLSCLKYFINFTENVAFNGIIVPTMSIYEIIIFYIFIFLSLYLFNNKNNKCGYFGFAILLFFYIITYILIPCLDISLYLSIVDVGQGMFSTITYNNKNLIIDCGSTSNKGVGEYTVVPYLTKRGFKNIDGVFISHWDFDHYSAINDLMNNKYINVKNIFSSEDNEDIDFIIKIIKRNDYIKINKLLNIEILSPDKNYIADNKNNSSLVILIRYNGRSILFPGDIESNLEELIIDDLIPVDILILPHHGSKTSSSEVFVDKVSPKIGIISYGKNNYNIPSDDVIKRYEAINSKIYSTFKQGEINFILKNDKIYYNTYVGVKSDNFYELYFEWIISKLLLFCFLIAWMLILSSSERLMLHYKDCY